MKLKNICYGVAMLVTMIAASGCTILLPAHTKSNMTKGEQVVLAAIKCEDSLNEVFRDNYAKAFPGRSIQRSCDKVFIPTKRYGECVVIDSSKGSTKALPALAASALIGLGTDFVKKKLEEEKTLYTAQYKKSFQDDQFWKSVIFATQQNVDCISAETPNQSSQIGTQKADGYVLKPNYIGFELKRIIKDKNENDPALRVLYGLSLASDGRFFLLKPLYFEMNYAKAKVLSNQVGTWLFPPTLFMKLFKISKNTVDIELDFNMKAYWTDKGKEYKGPETIAAFKTNISGYDLSNSDKYGADKLGDDGGWLLVPPISDAIERYDGKPAGNFDLKIIVTERDTSEATKIIETTEDWVSKGGKKLQEMVDKKD